MALIATAGGRVEDGSASGRILRGALEHRGHSVIDSRVVGEAELHAAVDRAPEAGAQAILVLTPEAFAPTDETVERVQALIARELPGFGELLRHAAYAEIGSAAMSLRAVGGLTADGLPIFAFPASAAVCRIAIEELIAPELGHLVRKAG